MHSLLSRTNNISSFLFTLLGTATFSTNISSHLLCSVNISISNVKIKQVRDYAVVEGKGDWATLNFNLTLNLSPVFNWNVRVIYVSLIAKYQTKDRGLNEITIWDKYYKRFENNIVDEKNISPSVHDFIDDGVNLLEKNVKFVLRWSLAPNTGLLWHVNGEGEIFINMPNSYNLR